MITHGQIVENGGPAFPQLCVVANERDGHGDVIEPYTSAQGGMTLRDWFAGQALAAMATPHALKAVSDQGGDPAATMANSAYAIADAMLNVRAEPSVTTEPKP